MMVELESDNLILRQFRESDMDDFSALCADAEVMRFLGGKPFSRLDTWRQMARILGHWQIRGYGEWALEERSSGRFVGRVGLIYPDGWPGFEIGWALVRDSWGKGYATEGARRALQYAFGELGRRHVISLIHPDNLRSAAVATRIGERHQKTIDFLHQEIHVYGLDRESWERHSD